MRTALWKRLIPAIGLLALALAFAIPAGAQAATTASTTATRTAALVAPALSPGQCPLFHFFQAGIDGKVPYARGAVNLNWTLSGNYGTFGDTFCQELVPGTASNVTITDKSDQSYCLAYNATTKFVYLHPSCPVNSTKTPSYEQWRLAPAPDGSGLYLFENGYQVGGVTKCLQVGDPAYLGDCNFAYTSAAMVYLPS